MNNNIPETAQLIPSDFVIIGGSGDLSVRKIIPALFWRFLDNQINNKYRITAITTIKNPVIENHSPPFFSMKSLNFEPNK